MKYKLNWWLNRLRALALHPGLGLQRLAYSAKRLVDDCRYAFGHYNYPERIFFLAGMPRGGSTWTMNLIAGIPGVYTRPTPMPEEISYNHNICDSAFTYVPKNGNTLIKTHLNPSRDNFECLLRNGVNKILVTYRDFRDVAVSRYYRLLHVPKPKKASDYIDYRILSKEEAMGHSIKVIACEYVNWIRGWHMLAAENPGRVHFIRYEDLRRNTKEEFRKVLSFYGITLSEGKIDEILHRSRGKGDKKENVVATYILPWAFTSTFRAGKVGGWQGDMSPTHIKKCKELLGDALIEFGYERDLNW